MAAAPAFAGSGPPGSGTAAPAHAYPSNAYVLRLAGLACPFCAFAVEKEFARQPGVENSSVNLGAGVLIVMVKPGTHFTDAQLSGFVRDAGFSLKSVVSRPAETTP
jgi:cation transport ATPase